MDDLTELLKRIHDFDTAYKMAGIKAPLFRLTPYEYGLFKDHLIKCVNFKPEYYGHLPRYYGVDFELVGKPQLFGGRHIRSDSGIEVT